MSFSVKDWKDDPDESTPLSAAALEDLETRLSGYTDSEVGSVSAALAGKADDADLTAHESATESVHGIADTADLIVEGDSRLTDDRDPTAHAASHATGQSDAIAPGDIGAVAASLLAASGVGVVAHDDNASAARPSEYAVVLWIGSVEPSNMVVGDLGVGWEPS